MGINGRHLVAESHPFSDPNRGVVGPDSAAYPLDLQGGIPREHGTEVEVEQSAHGDPHDVPGLNNPR
jgi:hypothetical protein